MNSYFLPNSGWWYSPGSKCVFGITLALALACVAPQHAQADRAHLDNTKTQVATLMQTPPVIDGVINTDEWQRANGSSGNWRISYDANQTNSLRGGFLVFGPPPSDNTDLNVQIYAGYDADNLYIAVRVTDNAIYDDSVNPDSANVKVEEDDSVEVYIDALNANDDNWSTGNLGGRYAISVNNAYNEAQAGNPGYGENKAWFAKAVRNDAGTGYDIEYRFSLKSLGNPKLGDVLGFNVVVNDDKDSGPVNKTFDRQVAWKGTPNKPVTYGNLLLGYKVYTSPLNTKSPKIDGKIDTSEYAGIQEIPINPQTGPVQTAVGNDTWPAGTFEAVAWVTHDTKAVYVAVDVIDINVVTDTAEAGSEDGNTWEDDSVEIFFDADLDKNRGGPTVDYEGQYVLTANGAHRDNEARNPTFGADTDWFAMTTKTAKGYQIEFKVNKTALLNPTNGTVMGFNIALNNDEGAGRIAQLSWNGDPHQEYTYGELILAAASVQPTLSIARNGANITITYTATLQSADTANGPWNNVANASSPFIITPTGGQKFFRTRQ